MSNQIKNIKISASILSANFAKLAEEIVALEHAGVDYLHLDVMDGHFVPNITFGPKLISDIRNITKLSFDTHLMINNPEKYIKDFADAGSDIITIHLESTIHVHKVIAMIKDCGKKVGVSIIPSTPANLLNEIIDDVDLILVMTVNPGFGGQKFITSQLNKIKKIRNKIDELGKDILLSVDGGVNDKTATDIVDAGANLLVAGSYIFNNKDYAQSINILKTL